MATLSSNTLVKHPETGERITLLKGETIPKWAADQIGDHLIEGTEPSAQPTAHPAAKAGRYPTAKEIAAEVVALLRQEMDDDQGDDSQDDDDSDELPPTSGRGSGLEAWVAYANAKGIAYPQGASRDEIIAAVEAHQQ